MRTPVAFFVFNRPSETVRTFEAIRNAAPDHLLIVADGPRSTRVGEAALCSEVRALVEERIDWPCNVMKLYASENLGCGRRVSSGLDWVFSQVDRAIILEDDCVPAPEFFRFSEEILEKYKDDERISQVCGCNFQRGSVTECSYYFSRYTHCWGWATWKRAWRNYRFSVDAWQNAPVYQRLSEREQRHWDWAFEQVRRGELDTWDYQWTLSTWKKDQLTIVPNVNMVVNIGFSESATHTAASPAGIKNQVQKLAFPLVHPSKVQSHLAADAFTSTVFFRPPGVRERLGRRLRRLVRACRSKRGE